MTYRRGEVQPRPVQSERQTTLSPHCTKRLCDGSCHPSGYHLRPRPVQPATSILFLKEYQFPHIKETLNGFCKVSEDVFSADPQRDPDSIPRHPPRSSTSTLSGVNGDSFSIASSYDIYDYQVVHLNPDGLSSVLSDDTSACTPTSINDVSVPSKRGRSDAHLYRSQVPERSLNSRVLRWLDRVQTGDGRSYKHLPGRRCPSEDSSGQELRSSKRRRVASALRAME